jgi:uncharacterized integral membrane protein
VRLSTALVVVPVAIAAAILAVANRAPVTFSIDPFDPGDPLLSVTLPLFALVFLSFFLGALVGGATVGLKRRARLKRERLKKEPEATHRADAPPAP